MIRLPAFKRIFPVNRTNVYPFWGESYVDNWTKFEEFQPDIPQRTRNGRFYTSDVLRRAIMSFAFKGSCSTEIKFINPSAPPYGFDDVILVERTNEGDLTFRLDKGRNK